MKLSEKVNKIAVTVGGLDKRSFENWYGLVINDRLVSIQRFRSFPPTTMDFKYPLSNQDTIDIVEFDPGMLRNSTRYLGT
jgi:hypothetical protein